MKPYSEQLQEFTQELRSFANAMTPDFFENFEGVPKITPEPEVEAFREQIEQAIEHLLEAGDIADDNPRLFEYLASDLAENWEVPKLAAGLTTFKERIRGIRLATPCVLTESAVNEKHQLKEYISNLEAYRNQLERTNQNLRDQLKDRNRAL
jgi:hypothetical protein